MSQNNFLTGFVASVLSTTITHPIDVLKTNYQVKSSNIPVLIKSIISKKGLYKGLSTNLGTLPIFWGTFFQTRKYLEKDIITNKFLLSYISGNIASLACNPLFVLKVQKQIHPNISYSTIIADTYIKGYYRGFPATSINNMKLGIQFPLYDFLKDKTDNTVLSSGIAKTIANSVLYPLDLVRTNQRNNGLSMYTNFKNIYNNGGLFKGVIVYNCVSIPNFILLMVFIDILK